MPSVDKLAELKLSLSKVKFASMELCCSRAARWWRWTALSVVSCPGATWLSRTSEPERGERTRWQLISGTRAALLVWDPGLPAVPPPEPAPATRGGTALRPLRAPPPRASPSFRGVGSLLCPPRGRALRSRSPGAETSGWASRRAEPSRAVPCRVVPSRGDAGRAAPGVLPASGRPQPAAGRRRPQPGRAALPSEWVTEAGRPFGRGGRFSGPWPRVGCASLLRGGGGRAFRVGSCGSGRGGSAGKGAEGSPEVVPCRLVLGGGAAARRFHGAWSRSSRGCVFRTPSKFPLFSSLPHQQFSPLFGVEGCGKRGGRKRR